MGAFGYGPFDNDCGMDFRDEILESKKCKITLITGLKSNNQNTVRAAIQSLLSLKSFMSNSVYKKYSKIARESLNKILLDKEFLNCWEDKTKIVRSLKGQLRKL